MYRFLSVGALAVLMASAVYALPSPLQNSQISPNNNSYIHFDQNNSNGAGNTEFTFVNGTSTFANFTSANPNPPYGGLIGRFMDINGAFDIVGGTTLTDGSGNQTATVVNDPATGVHQLEIFGDGTGILTADLVWLTISSNSAQSGQNLNLNGVVNLSNFAYSAGTDSATVKTALQDIVATAPGTLTLSVTGSGGSLPKVTDLLASLSVHNIGTTPGIVSPTGTGAFSLNLSTVPEPRFYGLLLMGLGAVAAAVMRRRRIA